MTRRNERGAAAVEVVLVAPILAMVMLVALLGGRLASARQAVHSAAADAARAASIARTATAARHDATQAARTNLDNHQLRCLRTSVTVDTSGFATPVGTPAEVRVTIVCHVPTGDLALPGLGGSVPVEATVSSPLDVFRERR